MFARQIYVCRFHQTVFKKIHWSQFLSNFVFKDSFGILNTRQKSNRLWSNYRLKLPSKIREITEQNSNCRGTTDIDYLFFYTFFLFFILSYLPLPLLISLRDRRAFREFLFFILTQLMYFYS